MVAGKETFSTAHRYSDGELGRERFDSRTVSGGSRISF
jgi:hypothetical protein